MVVPEALQAFSVCRLACVIYTGFWKIKQSCGSGVVQLLLEGAKQKKLELNLDARQLVSNVARNSKKEIFVSVGLNWCLLRSEGNCTIMLLADLEGSGDLIGLERGVSV